MFLHNVHVYCCRHLSKIPANKCMKTRAYYIEQLITRQLTSFKGELGDNQTFENVFCPTTRPSTFKSTRKRPRTRHMDWGRVVCREGLWELLLIQDGRFYENPATFDGHVSALKDYERI